VNVTDCPRSAGLWVTVGTGTTSAKLTVNEIVAVAVLPFPSVTVRVTVSGEPVVAVDVQLMEAAFELKHPVGRFDHA